MSGDQPPRESWWRRRRKRIGCAVAALGLLALLLAGLLWTSVATEPGARFVLQYISMLIPGVLEVEEAHGPLRGPLEALGVTWTKNGTVVTIERLAFDWDMPALLRKQLAIDDLYARGVTVRIEPPEEERRQLRDVNLRYNLIFRDALVEDVRVLRGDKEPLRIDRISFATAETPEGGVRIAELDVRSPHLDLEADGTLTPTGDYAVDLEVAWVYRPPEEDEPTYAGIGTLSGTLEELVIDQRLTEPGALRLQGVLYSPLYELSADVEALFDRLDPRVFAAEIPAMTASGRIQLEGSPRQLTSRGRLDADTERWGAVEADFALRRDGDRWHFAKVALTRPDGPTEVTLRGDLRTGDPLRFDGRMSWRHLTLPLTGGDPYLTSGDGTLTAEGTADDYAFQAEGTLQGPDVPQGRWRLSGHGDRRHVVAQQVQGQVLGGRVTGRATVRWQPAVAWSFRGVAAGVDWHSYWPAVPEPLSGGTWSLALDGDSDAVRIQRLEADTLRGHLSTTGRVAWDPAVDWRLTGTARGIDPGEIFPDLPLQLAGGSWEFAVSGDRDSLVIGRLRGRIHGGTITLTEGRVRWEPELDWRVTATLDGIRPAALIPQVPEEIPPGRWELRGSGSRTAMVIERLEGHFDGSTVVAEGTLDWRQELAWRVTATGEGIDPSDIFPQLPDELQRGRWELRGHGGSSAMVLEHLAGSVGGGRVEARGSLAWEPSLRWDVTGTARGVDPSAFLPEWPGEVSFDLAARGAMTAEGPTGRIVIRDLRGELRGEPVAGEAVVDLAGGAQQLSGISFTWGGAAVRLAGDLGPVLDATWELRSVELDKLLPGGRGVVTGSGTLTGPRDAPRVTGSLRGEQLAWEGYRARQLAASFDLDLSARGPLEAEVVATDVVADGRRAEGLTAQLVGTVTAHRLAATLVYPLGRWEVRLAGGFPRGIGDRHWEGRLQTLTLESRRAGDWRLADQAELVLSPELVLVEGFCWLSQGARACADLEWLAARGWQAQGLVEDLPLALLEPFLPPDVELEGELDALVSAAAPAGGAVVGEARLVPSPGARAFDATRGREVALIVEGGEVTIDAGPAGVTTELDLRLQEGATVRGTLLLLDYRVGRPLEGQPLRGELAARAADLAFLEVLVPEIASTSGSLTADLSVAGTLGDPRFFGNARIEDGAALVPRLGLSLQEIQLVAEGDGQGPLQIRGSLKSGPGTLQIRGTAVPVPTAEQPLRLELTGERVEVADLPEARILATPELLLVHTGERIELTGTVRIPQARIEYGGQEPGVVRESRDVIYVADGGEVVPERDDTSVAARVRVILGDDVHFEGAGVEARLTGSVLLVDEPGRPTTATGELELARGTFEVYGRELTIERGNIFWVGGAVTRPGLDIRAYRTAENGVIAGISAQGPLSNPRVTLWSEPAMSQSDALSYLVTGRPMSEATAAEGDVLANAAVTLGISGGNILAEKLAARFGLEEVRIQTEGSLEEAQLVLGKYLSPRVYVAYGIGLFEAVDTFRVRYLIDERWTLQAETGGGNTSADLLYTIERGGREPKLGEELERPRSMEELEPRKVPTEPGTEGDEEEDKDEEDEEEEEE
ncbi:MAG TPA: translocation/assembly module TamB domain-containing protein [Thermoanaerobaculia bacterium]|nr:translocation/assembly module TamB domain-containing protein [Thermoanaerobaculia bacterium]